jgi:hypothetical protein
LRVFRVAALQERRVAAGEQEMLWAAWRKVNAGKIKVVTQFG